MNRHSAARPWTLQATALNAGRAKGFIRRIPPAREVSLRFRSVVVGLVVSAVLHVALMAWLARRAGDRPPERTAAEVIELELFTPPPPRPPPVAGPTGAQAEAPKSPRERRPHREAEASASAAPPSAGNKEEAGPAPDAPSAPRAFSLTPSADALPFSGQSGVPIGPAPGRTLRPGDPGESRDVALARERANVGERVDGWMGDTLAGARAENGLAHPYIYEVRDQLAQTLAHTDGGTPKQLGVTNGFAQMEQNYARAREKYARGGDPGLPPPGHAPTQSERLQTMGQGGMPSAPMELRAMAQATETRAALESSAPLLTLVVELLQKPSGEVADVRVLSRSGNARFDAWVLKLVPDTVAKLGPIPQDALRGKAELLRTVWKIDGWLRSSNPLADSLSISGLPLQNLGAVGVPVDKVDQALGTQSLAFDFRVHLLRAY